MNDAKKSRSGEGAAVIKTTSSAANFIADSHEFASLKATAAAFERQIGGKP